MVNAALMGTEDFIITGGVQGDESFAGQLVAAVEKISEGNRFAVRQNLPFAIESFDRG